MFQHIVSYFDFPKDVITLCDGYILYETLFCIYIAIFFLSLFSSSV